MPAKWKGRWASQHAWQLEERLPLVLEQEGEAPAYREAPYDLTVPERIQVRLQRAETSEEKYNLFRRYQSVIHREKQDEISSRSGWEQFLESPETDGMPVGYGVHHQEYRFGVLDILPRCVSSVYFFYDPDYSHWQLGKVGALNEVALARRLRRNGAVSLQSYYLGTLEPNSGYYIHDCQKMRYKSQYGPCEVLDTFSNEWINLRKLSALLDQGVRCAFLQQQPTYRLPAPLEEHVQGLPRPLPPGTEDPKDPDAYSRDCLILTIDSRGAAKLNDISDAPRQARDRTMTCVAALGSARRKIAILHQDIYS